MLILSSLIFAAQIGLAQDEKVVTDSVGTSATEAESDSVEVVITPKRGQDSTIVKEAVMKIIVVNDDKNEPEKIIVDAEVGGKDIPTIKTNMLTT